MLRDRLRLLGLGHRTTANVIAARSITAEACTRHRHSLHVHSWWSLHRSHHLLLLSHHLSAHDGSIRHPLHHWLTSVAHSWVHLSLLVMVVVAILLSLVEPLLATLIGAHLVILMMIVVGTTSIIHLGVHRMTPSLLMALDTHLESRFEKHGQQIDQILGTTHVGKLRLTLLIALPLLSSFVMNLFIAYRAHLLGIAVLHVESILTLEEYISRELLGKLALILFLEVDEGLLSSRDHLDTRDFTLACRLEVDFQFLISGANREVLNEQTEEHDGLLVFKIVHLELLNSSGLLFCLSDIQIGDLDSFDHLVVLSWLLIVM